MATSVQPGKGEVARRADAEWAALHPSGTSNTSDPTKVTASNTSGSSSSSAAISVNVEAPDLTGLTKLAENVEEAQTGFDRFRENLKKTFAVPNLIDFGGGVVGVWVILAALTLLALETDAGQAVVKGATKAATKGLV